MAFASGTPSDEDAQRILASAMAATARGEAAGLTDLYRLTSAKLFGICLRICRNHQAAEDVLSEVYLSVWRGARTFDAGQGRPMTWLCAIARYRSIDWVRSNGRPMESDEVIATLASPDPDAETLASNGQERQRLFHCLEKLRQEQRDAIRTAFFDGVTYAELAERQRVPLGTMKTWIRRGLKNLKDCMNGD